MELFSFLFLYSDYKLLFKIFESNEGFSTYNFKNEILKLYKLFEFQITQEAIPI